MRVLGVVNNHGATETVAVLCRQVAVVPERAGLVIGGEFVRERVASGDRALVDEGTAVSPVGGALEHAVPVLKEDDRSQLLATMVQATRKWLTMVVAVNIVSLVRLSMTLSWKVSPCARREHERRASS